MKLRSKFIFSFTFLMLVLVCVLFFYLNSYIKNIIKNNVINNFQILAELSESSYFGFVRALEVRIIDWSSDSYIRNTTEDILETPVKDREPLVKALNSYLKNEKIIYDPEVIIIDILDKDGVVAASSRDERIGVDEKKEELELNAVRFTEAIKADFGQAFMTMVVSEEDEHSDPMMHLTTRIFSEKTYSGGLPVPLDAVMLLHFSNVARLRNVLIGNFQGEKDRLTSQALTEYYKTADIYLVNKAGLRLTPSRLSETILKQKVETEPVTACFERGEEIKAEYLDYRGQPVFGASMCLERDGLALVLEAESQEVLAPLKNIGRFLILIGSIAFISVIIGVIYLSNWLLKGLGIITGVAEKISKGDFGIRTKVNSKDEVGYLAKVFNGMLDLFQESQKKLKETEVKIKEVNVSLEEKVLEKTMELESIKINLEKVVAERTKDLEIKVDELKKFQRLTIGRELKMVELKKEFEELKKKIM
ncbi:hypothetical protein A3G50_01840 [Candidatus Jorgensenbacteria bacterium RIFCSPLOWO2_12_FULL_42_11]|uniref:histidine kinase n=1 Tax=Candidatus Jorgensenbacteria bacterium RIFCSPLOWO2_12_FULL_42_11 TaxID=1798473 RepID=A0A1F6C259_9BACT|nr:MAG: hypothetical protein A3G50_01840 [Candidatus Jorgensenbacteria bacterium RIFCSPLOWO2_12_FULL_42_11]